MQFRKKEYCKKDFQKIKGQQLQRQEQAKGQIGIAIFKDK